MVDRLSVRVLIFAVLLAILIHSPAFAGEPAEINAREAFSADAGDWHTVTIDLGSSVLVRIYGKILSGEAPGDVSVALGENLHFVNAWIGDSKGNSVAPDSDEKYLVIEGTAASMGDAAATVIYGISYSADGRRLTQFENEPLELVSAASASEQDSAGGGGGCASGAEGFFPLACMFAALAAGRLRGKIR